MDRKEKSLLGETSAERRARGLEAWCAVPVPQWREADVNCKVLTINSYPPFE